MVFFTKMECFSKLDYFLILSTALLFDIATGSRYSNPHSYPNYKIFMERMDVDGASNEQVCSTSGCNTAAQLIRGNIDEHADPCNNFYDFGCGGFVKKAQLSPDRPMVNHLQSVKEKVMQDLAKAFVEPSKPDEPRIFTLVKNYYKACMDLAAIDNVGIQPLLRIFDEIGGWPILKGPKWDEKKFNWMEADSILRANGFPPTRIVKLFVFNDIRNTSENLLHIEPAELDIPPTILTQNLSDPVVQTYLNFMADIAEAFGADRNLSRSQLIDVLAFERTIHTAIMDEQAIPGPDINTIDELEMTLGNLPWKNYLNGLTEPIFSLSGHNKIMVLNTNYLKRMDAVLPSVSNTILANYMIWKIIAESIPNLGMSIQRILTAYKSSQNSSFDYLIQVPDRSKQCVLFSTDQNQGITVGVSALYTRKYFSNETKIDIKDIVHSIGDEFKSFILQVSWLNDAAKIKAIRKILYMKQIVGYPNELDNDVLIDNYSKSLVIEPDKHFQNVLNVRRFHYDDAIASLGEPADKRSWITFSDATTINAFYYLMANSFVLLAAILQYPVYDPRWPAYIKYGSVGFIIGHETMHAYDFDGVKHDETGSLRKNFSSTVEREYLSRVNCYVDQYSQYHDYSLNLNVNGTLTVNENLSDNVGVKVALAAYKKWTQEHPDEPKLPGLVYTPAQLFWMSTVNIMCKKETDGVLMIMMLMDEHTPDKFRALGMLSNMPEFAKDFNCPPGSKMNPVNKCNLL